MYRVYIADDEHLVIRGLKRRINWERLNCQVIGSAQDGVCALQEILELQPDIVITDILMPEMDGLEVIRRASRQIDCAYIIFSGYSEFDYAKQALKLGTVDYLIKPVNIEEIESSIMKAEERLEQSSLRAASSLSVDQYAQLQMIRLLNGLESEAWELNQYSVFQAVVIGGGKGEAKQLTEQLKELENPVCRVFLAKDKNALVLVAAAKEERDIAYFRKRLAVKMEKLRRQYSHCYWGLGCLCDSARELAVSYARANEMLNYCQFTGQQIDEEYVLNAYRPSDFRDWIRDIAAMAVQESETDEARQEMQRLAKSVVHHKLSVCAIRDLGRDLLYEMRLAFEKTMGEAAEKEAGEIFSASQMEDIQSIEQMQECLNGRIRSMRDYMSGQVLELRKGQMDRIRAFIRQNLSLPLTLSQIAQSVKMNPSYVSHFFRKESGIHLFEYIAQERVKRAQDLLRTTDWKIARISSEVGYEDQRYFCQVFKKQMGITATQYRCAVLDQEGDIKK